MKLVAFQAAGRRCSVAAFDDRSGSLVQEAGERGQVEPLVPLLDRTLATAGWRFGDLDLVAVDVGPGSFTAIRSAVAIGRALALASDLPVMPVTSLEALAGAAREAAAGRALVVLRDARRDELFMQRFTADAVPEDQPRLVRIEAAVPELPTDCLLVGDGAPILLPFLAVGPVSVEPVLDAAAVIRRAAWHLRKGTRPVQRDDLMPLYLRAPDARSDAGAPLVRVAAG